MCHDHDFWQAFAYFTRIALFVLVVAVAVNQLADATTGVIRDMITKITSE